ncbi:MGH1-like glycoside hydrolase domain-containing protein [Aquisphaera giovannonii]|uniref:MGH1-like glycoside hydrolase domain-containing protein n=1 Tax=Aquisphaera giovannonii TaxID=406548 RepID=UPI001AEF7630|nr:glucosidase [Aquisphaera giovannonii]
MSFDDAESIRLAEDARREKNWKRWGPYLPERQWATVREDYSPDNSCWTSFPYESSIARAYRWGEDGLLGITDRECRLAFAVALWNGADPHLKERLFGLTNPEGNHGEDVKEVYYYLDGTPTHSYLKALYKYPQGRFPYERLREENRARGRGKSEFELVDTGIFDEGRYWDVTVEYAKASPDDVLIRIRAVNRGPEPARLHVLPTLWFRNTWSWGVGYEEGRWSKPALSPVDGGVLAEHETLGRFVLLADVPDARWAFTENETNARVFEGPPNLDVLDGPGGEGRGPCKDAFHRLVVRGDRSAVVEHGGTKAALVREFEAPPGGEAVLRLRLVAEGEANAGASSSSFADFDAVLEDRICEADAFHHLRTPGPLHPEERLIARQAYAGLIWSEQFYHYIVPDWLEGDAKHPNPPEVRDHRINRDWTHLFSRDVLSVPDKWEYPAFFAWDLAFHMVAMARIDGAFAKQQLQLLLREWYMHPNGQLPAYEYDLSNVNPPVHAWACYQVFRRTGGDDFTFLERCFHKLLLNFTWWVNRQDPEGRGVFSGGFLGMDNLGVFDRSQPLPTDGRLQQADGTAWMGFFCTTMLQIALELAVRDPAYEDVASKFFEHYVFISDAINKTCGSGLWDEEDGFYYDKILRGDGSSLPIKLRAMIGLVPLLAVLVLDEQACGRHLPGFQKRLDWFLANRGGRMKRVEELETRGEKPRQRLLLSIAGRRRLERSLHRLLDESAFLSPFGVRSLSREYRDRPYELRIDGRTYSVPYVPGDSATGDFGGNSNWRGPIWMPINVLLIDALREYHRFYGDDVCVECPSGSGRLASLGQVADELCRRLTLLFLPEDGRPRPCHGSLGRFASDPAWKDHHLFYEYFDGDTGRGLGASHQTGWTALIATLIEDRARSHHRDRPEHGHHPHGRAVAPSRSPRPGAAEADLDGSPHRSRGEPNPIPTSRRGDAGG